jgi:hypothetical protein
MEHGRGLRRGVVKYARLHGRWSVYISPGHLEQMLPKANSWAGIIARIHSPQKAKLIQTTGLPVVASSLEKMRGTSATTISARSVLILVTSKKLDLSESTSVSHQGLVHRKEYCGMLRWTMRLAIDAFRLLLISLAGWLNQQQQDVIDYLQEENRVLREQLGGKRLRFNDGQRRGLAVRAKKLGWRMLHELTTIVSWDRTRAR